MLRYVVLDDHPRLDLFLLRQIHIGPENKPPTRSQVKKMISGGGVRINGLVVTKSGTRLHSGDVVEALPLKPTYTLDPLPLDLEILFEDSSLLVINKPAGLPMHHGSGTGIHTLVNALVYHFEKSGETSPVTLWSNEEERLRPGIVHRLDKDTTGVVVVAKNPSAHYYLAEQFRERTTGRIYKALALSTPRRHRLVDNESSGSIDTMIARDPKLKTRMTVSKEGGKRAITNWTVVERFGYGTLLDIVLETGRTHQIRVHLSSIGSPCVGDVLYGNDEVLPSSLKEAARLFGRQALHAATLDFTHPITGERLSFTAPLPDDMNRLIHTFSEYS